MDADAKRSGGGVGSMRTTGGTGRGSKMAKSYERLLWIAPNAYKKKSSKQFQ